MCSSGFWTSVGHKLLDLRPIVEVIPQCIPGVLLVVERYSERNGLLDDIRGWRFALKVGRVVDLCRHGSRTEAAFGLVFREFYEIFAPNFYSRLSILWSVPRVECNDPCGGVVGVFDTILRVVEQTI